MAVSRDDLPTWRNLYGRRHGKPLKANQKRHLETLLPVLAIPGVVRGGPQLKAIFPDGRPVWLEIGFGAGEHLVHTATERPDIGLIGCEPFVNGVAMAIGKIDAAGVSNVRLHMGDARDLIELLPDASIERVFLLYPDPWPKARHQKRRFANPENLALLARVMVPGAELRLATDIPDYVEHALAAVEEAPDFALVPGRGVDLAWPDWAGTRYEEKALAAGRRPHYLSFRRA